MSESTARCWSCKAQKVLDARGCCAFCGAAQGESRSKLSRQEVSTYYDVHKRGRPIWEIAKAIWKAKGYASPVSARSSLVGQFEREEVRRGLREARPRKPRGSRRRLSEEQVAEAYRRYREEGISAHALAKEIYREAGYASPSSCETALGRAFHEAGYEVRERIAATRLASTKHGMAPKHGPRPGYGPYKRRVLRGQDDRPLCAGRKETSPEKGRPCERRAMRGSAFCPGHDPERRERRRAHLARLHEQTRRRAAAGALPMEPFAAFVRRCVREAGTQGAAAERLGLSTSSVNVYCRGLGSDKRPKATIQRRTVERILACEGRALSDIYPEQAAMAGAEDEERVDGTALREDNEGSP